MINPLVLSALLSLSAHAKPMVVGRYMEPVTVPEATCRLAVEKDGEEDFKSCSATLISPTKIVTANHCFTDGVIGVPAIPARMGRATVICTDSKGIAHPAHLDSQEFMFSPDLSQDTVLAELELPITDVSPMKVATDSEINQIMSNPIAYECAVVGYGKDNQGVIGTKHGALITTGLRYKGDSAIEFSQETDLNPSKAIIQNGDSGGSLICKLNNEWKLIGVNKETNSDPATGGEISGDSAMISIEKLYAMRDAVINKSPERIANYSTKKQIRIPLAQFTNESTKISELFKAGYSLQELANANYPLKLIAKKTGASLTDFIQAGFDRKKVIDQLIPTFPKYLNPFKPGQEIEWTNTRIGEVSIRNGAIPCSLIESGSDGMLLYNAEIREIRDNPKNSSDKNRRYFKSRASGEDYLIHSDPRCLGKGLKLFVEKNRISQSELRAAGMSDHLIQMLAAQATTSTRSPAPKTTQGKKPAVQANPVRH